MTMKYKFVKIFFNRAFSRILAHSRDSQILAQTRAYSRILAHTCAYSHIRAHTAHTRAYSRILAHTRAYSRILAHTCAYSRILEHTRAYPALSRPPTGSRAFPSQCSFRSLGNRVPSKNANALQLVTHVLTLVLGS